MMTGKLLLTITFLLAAGRRIAFAASSAPSLVSGPSGRRPRSPLARCPAFVPTAAAPAHNAHRGRNSRRVVGPAIPRSASADAGDDPPPTGSEGGEGRGPALVGVVAPLRYAGPYPVLSLRFPRLPPSPRQKSRGDVDDGAVLSFVLDTGANVNSLDSRIVERLSLPVAVLKEDLPIVGTAGVGGAFQAGDVHALGDCRLEGLPPDQNFTFMNNLTVASLGRASPVVDGLLSLQFFLSFPAGVEFDWYGTDGDPPTVIFYYGKELPVEPENVRRGLVRVPLERLAVQVMTVNVTVNGTEMPALLDTGSPITVLNERAAEEAGIELAAEEEEGERAPPRPPLRALQRRQAAGDDGLAVLGVDGGLVPLRRSGGSVPVRAGEVSLGEGPVYVGDLPGLALMGGISGLSPPAAVLGLDALRRTYRMVLRAPENEVWFEELGDQPRGPGF